MTSFAAFALSEHHMRVLVANPNKRALAETVTNVTVQMISIHWKARALGGVYMLKCGKTRAFWRVLRVGVL